MNGCCDNGVCVNQRDNARCGTGAAACQPCAPCHLCGNNGTCALDPNSTWGITCVSANILSQMANGMTWDPGGITTSPPDPFCRLDANGGTFGQSATLANTLTPQWDESLTSSGLFTPTFLMDNTPNWQISVRDDDTTGGQAASQLICSTSTNAQVLRAADFEAGQVNVPTNGPGGRCMTLTIQLTCMP
jgi:hypothetical protein